MNKTDNQYLKRSQKDYSYSFKLQVVGEVERGELSQNQAKKKYGIQGASTVRNWIEKFGNFDRSYELAKKKMKSPEQKIFELEQRVKLLEKQNKSLAHELEQTDKKAIFFDMMIDIAEEEFKIPIRKKSLSNPSTVSNRPTKKA